MYNAKKCPKCGSRSLCFESGSYEEGYGDYIYCDNENCEETFLVSEIKRMETTYLGGLILIQFYGHQEVKQKRKEWNIEKRSAILKILKVGKILFGIMFEDK